MQGLAEVPDATKGRTTVIQVRGTAPYAAWLDVIHQRTYIPKAQIVRLALAAWAEHNGHPAPPSS